MKTLLWFQRDLRVTNNPALNWAIHRGKPIVAVYIHSPEENAPWAEGGASRWWLHHSLQKLQGKLAQQNIRLHFFEGNSETLIPFLVECCSADAVGWTNRIEPQRRQCESNIERDLGRFEIEVKRFKDGLLKSPEQLLTAAKNTPYLVFTPFYRRLRSQLDLSQPLVATSTATRVNFLEPIEISGAQTLDQLNLLGGRNWYEKFDRYWTPGEDAALARVRLFSRELLEKYGVQRDFPAIDGTSALSAHLHFGEISVLQILDELIPLLEFSRPDMSAAAEGFLRQLIWREFARYILWHFPATAVEPMNKKFTASFWRNDAQVLRKWQRGETGIPIVDAGMKQLWETGWMHNRVRMLVASLLTKNLGLPWQEGAGWFWDTLVDADLANNSMGWQWVAGCGVDAAPYFRIFNPHTQARRFDVDHKYQSRWLALHPKPPELNPLVDPATSRKAALDRYKRLGNPGTQP